MGINISGFQKWVVRMSHHIGLNPSLISRDGKQKKFEGVRKKLPSNLKVELFQAPNDYDCSLEWLYYNGCLYPVGDLERVKTIEVNGERRKV